MLMGDWILLAAAGIMSVPLVVLAVEAAASLARVPSLPRSDQRPRSAVLIPAHNEETGIAATVQNVQKQLAPGDRVVVIADNCSDATATIAREAGADVIERTDANRRGKGFALEFGLSELIADPPDVVVVVDADCYLAPGALDALARQAAATRQPAQGVYLIGSGTEDDPRRRLSAFAVLLKNKIRPLGLHRLGLPCLLTGTGMAFPWPVVRLANLGTPNIVEDMKLGVDLAIAGHSPRLCPDAELNSAPAPDRPSTIRQRTRWEHGHMHTLLTQAPRLLAAGVFRGRPRLIALGLELAVPPLSLLFVSWIVLLTICLAWWHWLNGSWAPALTLGTAAVLAGFTLLLAWWRFGRQMLPAATLALAPMYVVWKLPIYVKMVISREKRWVRTERGNG
jgi:cellulose synthase/poly-beta-1,6-N-acetylglucosamine synthase-like glycosyltransferase